MEVGRESLQRRYADLTDAELLRRLHSVELTELAREVLLEELQARGVSPDPAPADSAPAPAAKTAADGSAAVAASAPPDSAADAIELQDSGAELGADRFADNLYQAPRAPRVLRPEKYPGPSPLLQLAWWIYIGLLAASIGLVIVVHLATDAPDKELLELAPGVAAAVGLVGWRLRKPLLHPLLWAACLAVILAQFGAALVEYPSLLREWPDERQLLLLSAVFGTLFELPTIWGLTRYAFLSGAIWRATPRGPG